MSPRGAGSAQHRPERMRAHGGAGLASEAAMARGLPRRAVALSPSEASRVAAVVERARLVWLAEPVPVRDGSALLVVAFDPAMIREPLPAWLATAPISEPKP